MDEEWSNKWIGKEVLNELEIKYWMNWKLSIKWIGNEILNESEIKYWMNWK